MSESATADDATSTSDGAPGAKKARVDLPAISRKSLPKNDDVGPHNAPQGEPRKGKLTLAIDDWEAFKRSTGTLSSDPQVLAEVEWKAEAYVENGCFQVGLRASAPAGQAKWVRNVDFVVRWPRRPHEEYVARPAVFHPGSLAWTVTTQFYHVGVVDNKLELTIDFTIYHCHITEGAFGIGPSCFHDVTFVIENHRVYGNKGVLAANSGYFQKQFSGDSPDENKDDDDVILDVQLADFHLFLMSIAAGPFSVFPPYMHQQVLVLLRMAHRFEAHSLAERCVTFLARVNPTNIGFVEQLAIADELNMTSFRDLLLEYASVDEISEAASAENEDKFTKHTWVQLFLKYKQLKAEELGRALHCISAISHR